ncbi:carbon storage regulator CsrA [Leptospira wolffii]|uniref:Translational regulator CsrA n=1 Tax=Leptospira wolffii TaxID=409998 RepID=A0A2M9ZF20_9LEPT|nr:carbon storage regulator CsrA [Leptospira wolffii]EPG65298.1 carbon storage regulator [Leptospira wolffii serovar Khorat str. Khorat-H2]PJZ66982.1 carbon storage regulator [Leptospira wolffii]TGK61954.1 carbon storage regulator [Leptospira wolffii]TGK68555.1 carbon storage regulator [Leptospira wolffii]TGK74662.1 carbon storage regulator [Leptospira wolffii]
MLVLARRTNESIIIGDDIEIVIVDIKGDQVKIGVKAPKEVSVHRAEVYREIQAENKKAAGTKIRPEDLGKIGSMLKKSDSGKKDKS